MASAYTMIFTARKVNKGYAVYKGDIRIRPDYEFPTKERAESYIKMLLGLFYQEK